MVTKTKVNVGPSQHNYLAVEPVEGYPRHVTAIASSFSAAIAACLLKKEAREAAQERKAALQVSLLCQGAQ